jgi:hypothetical protein
VKYFSYELSDWTWFDRNLYRTNDQRHAKQFLIGLVCLYKPNPIQNTHELWQDDDKLCDCNWRVSVLDWSGDLQYHTIALLKEAGLYRKEYSYSELDQARKELDNFIIRVDKLKLFI